MTDWLRDQLGVGKLLIPMGLAAPDARRGCAICARLIGGRSTARIARELRAAGRTISRHKARLARLGLLSSKDPSR